MIRPPRLRDAPALRLGDGPGRKPGGFQSLPLAVRESPLPGSRTVFSAVPLA